MQYSVDELIGRSLYSLVYGQDIVQIRKCHTDCQSGADALQQMLTVSLSLQYYTKDRS